MNIAIMSHDNRKDLMVQFCTAYAGILSQHNLYATNTTGHMVAEATGLKVHCFLSYAHGGSQQIGARIAYNEFDLVLFFNDPSNEKMPVRSVTSPACATRTMCPSPATLPRRKCWYWVWPGVIWTGV